jgi:hypothetical protein
MMEGTKEKLIVNGNDETPAWQDEAINEENDACSMMDTWIEDGRLMLGPSSEYTYTPAEEDEAINEEMMCDVPTPAWQDEALNEKEAIERANSPEETTGS